MNKLIVIFVFTLCAGCQYFSYQDSCSDDPDQLGCDGSHQAESHRK
ncbi:hypothetical protein LZ023_04575 [Pseudomonas silvicola]|nr:hypothetical protein LZ023_20990 [Pseudomonas silvicola]WAH58858.1 hypothetical protein LZ023_04575 [Pseudomonas silvicola]